MKVRFLPAGDTAMVVEFGRDIDRALSERVVRLSDRLRALAPHGLVETVPTFRSLAVHYDPTTTSADAMTQTIHGLLTDDARQTASTRLWRVPACYDGGYAPDLAEVAERAGLRPEQVVDLHAATQFHIYMVGFMPGFPYMGDLPAALNLPRRADPRVRVPAGSVAIAMTMTGIYPLESPGGWHLIGATPIRLFDVGWERPALFGPGDAVRFDPIPPDEFETIRAAAAAGDYVVPGETLDG
jgi:inhibitor of KinA